MWRVTLAFLLCMLAYPLFLLTTQSSRASIFAFIAAVVTGLASLVGLAIFAWFRRRGWLRLWQFAVGGALIGASVSVVFAVIQWSTFVHALGVCTALGAGHAVLFWLVAVFRNSALLEESAEESVHNAT
jgi:hypothetical protein